MDVFKIDDRAYPKIHVVDLTRKFNVLDGPLSGRTTLGSMIRDIVDTYYNYTMELKCDQLSQQEYDEFYLLISYPADYHKLTVPFGQYMYDFNAYITVGEDKLKHMSETQGNFWEGLTCDFIAMKPARRPMG